MNIQVQVDGENQQTETIDCLLCGAPENLPWATENGYTAVKCLNCGLIYVNPRPSMQLITEGVETGVHREVHHNRTAIAYRIGKNVNRYRKIFSSIFADVWEAGKPISWLDVGAGYGEIIESVLALAPKGSTIEGIEPMQPKAKRAQERGLPVRQGYLSDVSGEYDFISLINVYSHIPDFRHFLLEVKNSLKSSGEFLIETGNIGDLNSRTDVPTDLDLPDHLVFAGEQNIIQFLSEAGFVVVSITRLRKDGVTNFAKNIVRKALGRPVSIRVPYTSDYRTLLIRAKRKSDSTND